MDLSLITPAKDAVALYDYWAHIAEVSVQFLAVVLLFWAVTLATRANETANKALIAAQKDFAKEREEYAKAMTDQRYDVLDKIYMELVLLRVEHPDFNEPARLYAPDASGDLIREKSAYQSYALALFNFLETIADKCHDEVNAMIADRKDETPALVETWAPILISESWQHRLWFQDQLSRVDDRFKEKFRKLVATVAATKSRDENTMIDPLKLMRTSYA